jgi:2-polyprenyl-3-methyl-5-hydroxy-6-metoxy-1,4-benzoquinol methylase
VYCCLPQVESFLLLLQPLLEAAGHSTPCAHTQDLQLQAQQPLTRPQQPQQQPHWGWQQQQQQPQRPRAVSLRIVDFGCGTGNLLLPLAALLPHCHFTGVDMKPAALQLLQQRAAVAGLSNVSVFTGMIEQFKQRFDVALALHACGNATDHVLQVSMT